MIWYKKYALTLLALLAVLAPADARRKPKEEPKIKVSCPSFDVSCRLL